MWVWKTARLAGYCDECLAIEFFRVMWHPTQATKPTSFLDAANLQHKGYSRLRQAYYP